MAWVPGALDRTLRGISMHCKQFIAFAVRLRRHPRSASTNEWTFELVTKAGAAWLDVQEV
jgi:hypothetical protein